MGKRFGRVEFYLSVPGAWIDLFERGQGARKRSIFRKVSSFTTELGTTISYLYNGHNHVSVLAASRREGTGFLGQPMVRASIAGLVLGLACQLLPADVAAFLVDGIASPLLSLSVTILSGIMGPIIFLSLVSSIIALGDIDTLNSLGTKVFVRFLLIAALICGITLAWHLPSSPSSATRARDSTPMPSSTSCSPSSRPTS